MFSVKCVNDKRVIHLIVIYAHCLAATSYRCVVNNARSIRKRTRRTIRDPKCNKHRGHRRRTPSQQQQQQHRSHFEMAIAIFSGTRCFAYENIFIVIYRSSVVMGDSSFFINSFIAINESKHRYGLASAKGVTVEVGGRKNICVCRRQQIFSMQLSETHFRRFYLISQKCNGTQTKA